jgi:hypothetical protein
MKQIPIIPLKSQFYLVSVYANGVPDASNCNNLAEIRARKCANKTESGFGKTELGFCSLIMSPVP